MSHQYGSVAAGLHEPRFSESTALLDPAGSSPAGRGPIATTLGIILDTINMKTVFITTMTVLSTLICHRFGLTLDVSTDFIGVAVMFPIGIGINGAFNRREEALRSLSIIKGNVFAIRLAHSHWVGDRPGRMELAAAVEELLCRLCADIKAYLTPAEFTPAAAKPIMQGLSALSQKSEALRSSGVPSPELAQLNERIREIAVHFEILKNIRVYRTPIAMRGYSKFFILLFLLIFGPTFNNWSIMESSTIWHGVILSVVYSVILTGLDNVQEALENPFDGDGKDDIQFYEPSYVLHMPLI